MITLLPLLATWLPAIRRWAGATLLALIFIVCFFGTIKFAEIHGRRAGWAERDAQAQIEQRKAIAATAEAYAKLLRENTADAAKRDAAARTRIAQLQATAARHKQTLDAHLAAQEQTPYLENPHDPTPPLLGQSVLDGRTVRLLNAARRGEPAPEDGGAAAGADEESRPTAVTGRALALNDLDVVRLYHELAARHDGLVEWVNHQLAAEPQPTTP